MSHGLPTQPAQTFVQRRRALAARLGKPALLRKVARTASVRLASSQRSQGMA